MFTYDQQIPHCLLHRGVTSNLSQRIYEQKTGTGSLFCSKYNVKKLVWFDEFPTISQAIVREKQVKRYKREWKLNLIREINPRFRDLYGEL